jgi:hypothetical protein
MGSKDLSSIAEFTTSVNSLVAALPAPNISLKFNFDDSYFGPSISHLMRTLAISEKLAVTLP